MKRENGKQTWQNVAVITVGMLSLMALTEIARAARLAHINESTGATAIRANGSDRDGNREIYVMNNDGTNQVRLTTNPVRDDHPAWWPDGRKIAFLSGNSLKLMNADGTNQTQLTTAAVEQNCADDFGLSCGLSWSPDGTKIAFTDFADIVVINIDGSDRGEKSNPKG